VVRFEAEDLAVLAYIDEIIPFLGGIYITAIAFGYLPPPVHRLAWERWFRRWSGVMKAGGPALILFAVVMILGKVMGWR